MEIKADGSPVTSADRAAHEIICRGLAALDASIPIVSEEAPERLPADRSGWRRYWLVDPLDGTRSSSPAVRSIHRQYRADRSRGARPGRGRRAGVADDLLRRPPPRKLAANGNTSRTRGCPRPPAPARDFASSKAVPHPSPELERYLAQFPIDERIAIGSSPKFCRIAEGLADCYPRLGPTMAWDVAAGDCVFRNACDGPVLHASPLRYDPRDFRQAGFVIGFVPRGFDANGARRT